MDYHLIQLFTKLSTTVNGYRYVINDHLQLAMHLSLCSADSLLYNKQCFTVCAES